MKNLTAILLLTALILAGCQQKTLSPVSSIKLGKTFDININGTFADNWVISPSQVRDEIDLPEDATIDEVNIESIWATVKVLDDNEASSVVLSGYLDPVGVTKPVIFNDVPVPLSGVNEPFGINTIVSLGLQTLKSKIEQYLETGLGEPTVFQIVGVSSPANEKVHIVLDLFISGTVKYHYCIDVPFFFDLPDCN